MHEAWTCDMEEVVRYVFNTPVVQQIPIRECLTMEGHCLCLQVVLQAHVHTWGIPCCDQTNITFYAYAWEHSFLHIHARRN